MTLHDQLASQGTFLRGLRVLELGDGVAGAAASSVLWALGAAVTTVIDPAAIHRQGRPAITVDSTRSLLALTLDRGKHIVPEHASGSLEQLLEADGAPYDVVIVDRVRGVSGPLASLGDVDSYLELVEAHNTNAWVTISAFGLSGPRANDYATELTVAAAGGMLATVRDPASGQPLKLAGQQSLLNTGQVGALAACHALDLAADGTPSHLDLSAVEATVATGPVLEIGGLTLNTGTLGGARRYGAPAGFYECVDGTARVSAMEDHQWKGVVAAMGSPDWTARFDSVQSRIDGADEIDAHIAQWCRGRTKGEVESVLQSHGVPATAVYSPAELVESPQLAHRGALEPLHLPDGRESRVVGLPAIIKPDSSSPRERSLRGLRMLEASRVLAVPLSGSILGALGATVTKLEDTARLDMYRRRGPYIDGDPGIERSAYFTLVNHSKASVAFDAEAHPDRLGRRVAESDVVIENLGAKRAAVLGLDAATVLDRHPGRLVVSSSAFGLDGPRAKYRAYAYNLQASCALGYLTQTADGEPAEIDIAWADLVSGFALATLVAAWAVGPEGNGGAAIDFSMADLIIGHFNEFIAAASLGVETDEVADQANELWPYAPHGVYPTKDGWLALSVEDDEQFDHLAKALDHGGLTEPVFTTAQARLEQRALLDDRVANATRAHPSRALAESLRSVGIAAEPVADAQQLLDDGHLAARGFFVEVDHFEWGQRRIVGIPWRPVGSSPIPLAAPPRYEPLEDEPRDDAR